MYIHVEMVLSYLTSDAFLRYAIPLGVVVFSFWIFFRAIAAYKIDYNYNRKIERNEELDLKLYRHSLHLKLDTILSELDELNESSKDSE